MLEALAFGVSASAPRTLVATVATLVVVSLLAGVLPAYRALRLDPSRAPQGWWTSRIGTFPADDSKLVGLQATCAE